MSSTSDPQNREGTEALIAEWMSRPWPNALDAPGDYYAEVVIPTLLAEVERLRGLLADTERDAEYGL